MKTSTKISLTLGLGASALTLALGFLLGCKTTASQPCRRRIRIMDLVLEIDRVKSLETLTKGMPESKRNLYYERLVITTFLQTAAKSGAIVVVAPDKTLLVTGTSAFRYLPQYTDEKEPREICYFLRLITHKRDITQFAGFTLTRLQVEPEPGQTINFDTFRVTAA